MVIIEEHEYVLIKVYSQAPLTSSYVNQSLLFSVAESVEPELGMDRSISVKKSKMYSKTTLNKRKVTRNHWKLKSVQVRLT